MDRNTDYIIEVAKYKSIIRAAEKLCITPSALSKFVKNKEQELGVTLFDRVGKKFDLTYAGTRYIECARKISILQKKMHNEMIDIAEHRSGRIHFGFPLIQSENIISEIMPEFKSKYPEIDIIFFGNTTVKLLKMIEDSRLDFAIMTVENRVDKFLYQKLSFEEFVLAVPANHPLIKKAVTKKEFRYPWVDIKLFEQENFIMLYPQQKIKKFSDYVFQSYDIKPKTDIQVPTVDLSLLCVANNLGITITLDKPIVSEKFIDKIIPLSFGEKPERRELCLVWNRNHSIDHVKILMDIFIDKYSK